MTSMAHPVSSESTASTEYSPCSSEEEAPQTRVLSMEATPRGRRRVPRLPLPSSPGPATRRPATAPAVRHCPRPGCNSTRIIDGGAPGGLTGRCAECHFEWQPAPPTKGACPRPHCGSEHTVEWMNHLRLCLACGLGWEPGQGPDLCKKKRHILTLQLDSHGTLYHVCHKCGKKEKKWQSAPVD